MIIGYTTKKDDYLVQKLHEFKKKYSVITLTENIQEADLIIANQFSEEDLEKATHLKALLLPYTGVNSLPLQKYKERGIQIVNAHAHGRIVAERAFSLALSLLSRIVVLHEGLKEGHWGLAQWQSLYGLKCGILGCGEIGQWIIRYLAPFNCDIVTLKRYESKCGNATYYDSVEDVCLHSDIVFVSLPLTHATKNIVSKSILEKMNGKYIINVGRGDVINEEGLFLALKNHILKGAGIDVWYQYPKGKDFTYPSKFPFHEMDHVILSPHCAGNEMHTRKEIDDELIENLEYYLVNNRFKKVVDLDAEY